MLAHPIFHDIDSFYQAAQFAIHGSHFRYMMSARIFLLQTTLHVILLLVYCRVSVADGGTHKLSDTL